LVDVLAAPSTLLVVLEAVLSTLLFVLVAATSLLKMMGRRSNSHNAAMVARMESFLQRFLGRSEGLPPLLASPHSFVDRKDFGF
jgi:hypothetical protein